jgi:hypothetical protein
MKFPTGLALRHDVVTAISNDCAEVLFRELSVLRALTDPLVASVALKTMTRYPNEWKHSSAAKPHFDS